MATGGLLVWQGALDFMCCQGLIAAHRLELLDAFRAADAAAHQGVLEGTVSIGEWGGCIKAVLPELLIPWPDCCKLLGMQGMPHGSIEYENVLDSLGGLGPNTCNTLS